MRNFNYKIFTTYNFFFLLSFVFCRFFPFLVFFLGAHFLKSFQYVDLENIIAISSLLIPFIGLGMTSVIVIIKRNKVNLNLIARHVQIATTALFLFSTILYFTDYYLILNITSILIILLITHSTVSYLKINNNRIIGLLVESSLYFVIFILFIFYFFKDIQLEYNFLQTNTFYFLSLIYLITYFVYHKPKIYIDGKSKDVIKIYKRSYGILISAIIISFLTLYPRVFIQFFSEEQQFNFLFNYRIALLGIIIHQIISVFFFRNIFKSNWSKIINLILIATFLTLIASILFVSFYIFLNQFEILNLKSISYNYYIIIQIFLLSSVSYINVILVRSEKSIRFYKKNVLFYLTFYIFSFLSFKFFQLNITYLSIFHIASMLSYLYLSCNFLTKIIASKKISYLKKMFDMISLIILFLTIFNFFYD